MLALSLIVDPIELARVTGGADASFGRCGPGAGMAFLGDVRTPACARHDGLVDQYRAAGDSALVAHLRAAPALPAAIGSYVGVRYQQLTDALGGAAK
ncbi:MAG: hypothetical protein IPL61_26995 [Myxococcales bacterium]|nr:hypothetical protein [Myxococcales bacterium]